VNKRFLDLSLLAGFLLASACSSTGNQPAGTVEVSRELILPESYLAETISEEAKEAASDSSGEISDSDGELKDVRGGIAKIDSLVWAQKGLVEKDSPYKSLPAGGQFSASTEAMPLKDFIHYVFGQLFSVNYVLGASIESNGDADNEKITLNLNRTVTSNELFDLTAQLLRERGVEYKYDNGTYFIFRGGESGPKSQMVIGLGRDEASVPKTNQKIMQVIPIRFGIKISLERSLRELVSAKVMPDYSQGVIYAEGSRAEILKVIELVDLLDTPANTGSHIGLLRPTFILPDALVSQVALLLKNEGIEAAINAPENKSLILVPLRELGAVAVFAANEFLIERVSHWASIIDVPAKGDFKQYFVYNPKYSRAKDLYESFTELLSLSEAGSGPGSGSSTGVAPSAARKSASNLEGIGLIVDSKSNSLVFYTTGIQYRSLMPLLKRLDVMPKQVMLDVLIAEVSLKDEFKHGVEWAVARGEVNLTTQGAFGAAGIGGVGLVINGTEGTLQASFLQTNNLVNVLSNPSLMVRDGTSATINVGSNISVVGETTQDPINGQRQTTSTTYRKTGVSIDVKVSVNAAGIVVLQINQVISNTVPGSSGSGGNPDIFERAITTEILARSGQTVMLGGLISESGSSGSNGVPAISKIPFIGGLFKSESTSTDRTELVMLVTPKVVEDLSGWDPVLEEFGAALRYLKR